MSRLIIHLKILKIGDLVIKFDLNHNIFGFISSLIKEDFPYLHDSRDPKEFCFSHMILKNHKVIKGVGIKVNSEEACLVISSSRQDIIDSIKNNIFNQTINQIDNILFKVSSIKENNNFPNSNAFEFETVSPICINYKTADKKYETYSSPKKDIDMFISQLKKNMLRKSKLEEGIIHIDILTETIREKLIQVKNQKIKCYHFKFMVVGDNELIKNSFYSGFGVKNSQGFGLTDILKHQTV